MQTNKRQSSPAGRICAWILCLAIAVGVLPGTALAATGNLFRDLLGGTGVSTEEEISLMGTLGQTAPKLDGDWVYLSKFEIQDDPATPGTVEGVKDGAAPFDTDTDPASETYKDRPGNDENDQNGKVRSFDVVTYTLAYATTVSGEYDNIKEGWLNYEMLLPYPSTEAVWQADSMAWVGTNVTDAAGLAALEKQTSGYYPLSETRTADFDGDGVVSAGETDVECQVLRGKYWIAPADSNPYALPGEGTLNAVVQVLAMEEGDTLQPMFSAWMEHNTVGETCDTHKRDELVSCVAPAVAVTAEVRLDIELSGWNTDSMVTANFTTGNADAPNYDKGTVTGRASAYMIGVYMWNGMSNREKGRKGLMAPKSGDTLTFDLTLSSQVAPTGGTAIPLNSTAYRPLLWALGSNDDKTNWRGRSTLMNTNLIFGLTANTPFDTHTLGDDACYNGGVWSYTVDAADPNKIHVSITGLEIDLTNFPHWRMDHEYNYDYSGAIPISSGQMYLMQPVEIGGAHMMTDTSLNGSALGSGKIDYTVTDDNMSYKYVSKTDDKTYELGNGDQTDKTNDIMGLGFYTEKGNGSYDSHVLWSNAPVDGLAEWIYNVGSPMGDTTGGKYYLELGGDPTVRNQNIGIWFGFYHQNDVTGDGGTIVAGNSLVKFDSAAVTPTGKTELEVTGYSLTVLYATKTDGSAWTSDEEMEATSMTALKYYAALADIPSGHKCVAVLAEYRPVDAAYTGVPGARQHMYADAGFTVNSDATEGELYQCTIENYAWSRDAYEALGKSIPSLLGASTLPAESWYWQPDYDKGVVDPATGHLAKDSGGFRWGDVMQVIGAQSTITKEIAQQENGANKVVYYMDSDQRFVDYKLQVSTSYVAYNVPTVPTGVKTTLTIVDELPDSLTFVPGSAYYGGTYTQSSVPGRQGAVTGGTQLTPTIISVGSISLITFEIPNIVVGESVLPIYFTAEIGTRGVEATDVNNGDKIINYALSRVDKEITSQNAYAGLNASGVSITVAKNGATSRSKLADKTYIELGDTFKWTINIGNNGGNTMNNVVALDVLPYDTDGTSVYTGARYLTAWKADTAVGNLSSWRAFYTDDVNVRGTASSDYKAADILAGSATVNGNTIAWTELTLDAATGELALPAKFAPAAVVMVGSLPGSKTLKINVEMQLANCRQGDVLTNWLDAYPSPVYVVKRAVEGCAWDDESKDGVRQDEEKLLSGVTVTLLKLPANPTPAPDPDKEADYRAVEDEDGNAVKVQTGKQIDAVSGAVTDYAEGRYQFTNLTPGTYALRFESGTVALDSYAASPVDKGTDDARDSDAEPTVTDGKLVKTMILNIPMPRAADTMKTANQVSRNNDSGLYRNKFNLTVSKTVTNGDKNKDFSFLMNLKTFAGPALTGTFDYTGDAIPGVTAPADGSITLSNGWASITLKHGQSITIEGLPTGTRYTVSETSLDAGWTVTTPESGDISGTLYGDCTAAFTNNYKSPETPPPSTVSVSAVKHWAGDNNPNQPSSVTVQLYRGGKAYGKPVELNAENYWSCRWNDLDAAYTWTVDETEVPQGYTKLVTHNGNRWIITNTYDFMLNTDDHFAYVIGYPDGDVRPDDNITRAEVAAIFFRMLTDATRERYWSSASSFGDVSAEAWYNNGVATMENTGVINGYSDGTFRPDEPITRAELVKLAVSFFRFTGDSAIASQFTDIQGHWAENYINFAYELGLVDGYPDGTFAPDRYVTRCEAMKLINHVLGRAPEKEHLLAGMITWPDNADTGAWYYAEVQEATNSHEYSRIELGGKTVEQWTELLPVRDWAAFEKAWSDAHSAPNPGEVVGG